ncbi:hypothetical protein OIU85_015851 [Salix viminalis]|uniref:Uncharacterized protein n=1 Tax=Salix viminalis TaxID=40686 RepID=A0A9Q0V3Y1_SALVM|nr:hypothetical protein OIU85_015851 [Salix viminalis]
MASSPISWILLCLSTVTRGIWGSALFVKYEGNEYVLEVIGSGSSFLIKPMLQPTAQQLFPRIGSGQVHAAKELVFSVKLYFHVQLVPPTHVLEEDNSTPLELWKVNNREQGSLNLAPWQYFQEQTKSNVPLLDRILVTKILLVLFTVRATED